MDLTLTDRNVGTLDVRGPLPHHLSPAPNSRKLTRNDSETSIGSGTTTPSVPRSSSFTGSKRFLTGKGLSARESLGIIDEPQRDDYSTTDSHFSYDAIRTLIMGTLSHSPKEAPPPPKPPASLSTFVGKRPPTPPPMPDFTASASATPKRVRINSKPLVEPPAAAPMATPPPTLSTPDRNLHVKLVDKKRTPLRTLSPLRNRLSLSPSTDTIVPRTNVQDPKGPRQSLFGLLSARITRREEVATTPTRDNTELSPNKQNTAPLNIADLAAAAKISYPTGKTDENNKPVFKDTSSGESTPDNTHTPGKPMVTIDHMHPETIQRPHIPLGRDRKIIEVTKDNESTETTESDKYKDCESPVMETRRRVEIFRRFRFVQEGRTRPEQLSDFMQTEVLEKAGNKPVAPALAMPPAPRMRMEPLDPISHHEDKLSFTSAHEDDERSSDERAPLAMRDVCEDPRMQLKMIRPVEPEPKSLEDEKGHLPHVESVTTSSSGHSKENSDSPPAEKRMATVICETSIPFTQAEMPHLRLGKGTVTAHAFISGPSPKKMGRVAQMRRDSHAAFLNINGDSMLEEIHYGGHKAERETAPLGPLSADDSPKQEGEMKKTMSGLQRILKEAGAELVSKAKKIPRGASFSKLRSNSMKDLRSSSSAKQMETNEETDHVPAHRAVKGMERSMSLPRDSIREASKPLPATSAPAHDACPSEVRATAHTTDEEVTPEVPEFVTIKRIIRRVRRDGTEEMITKKVRVRPERILPNGDVVIKRTMKRSKDDGEGSETLTVLQVIPRRKNVKKTACDGNSDGVARAKNDIASSLTLKSRIEDKQSEKLARRTAQNSYDDLPMKGLERSDSLGKRRSSSRSKTDMVDEGGRWRRARSFGRVLAETNSKEKGEHRGGVMEGMKGLLPRTKSGTRMVDRETAGLDGEGEEGRAWLKKKSLPRVMSFHGRSSRRKESGASSKSDGSWWRFRRGLA